MVRGKFRLAAASLATTVAAVFAGASAGTASLLLGRPVLR